MDARKSKLTSQPQLAQTQTLSDTAKAPSTHFRGAFDGYDDYRGGYNN